MDFAFTDEHLALREAVRRFCDGECPASERGNPEPAEQATRRWQGMAALGLTGLPIAAEHGGSAQGAVELMLVAQEFGRALAGGAFIARVALAGGLIARCGRADQRARWLPGLADGSLRPALAFEEDGIRHDLSRIATRAARDAEGWQIDGDKTLVIGGEDANLLLVLARAEGQPGDSTGLTLLAVEPDAPGLSAQSFPTLDNRHAARIRLHAVRAPADAELGQGGPVREAVEAALDAANAALVAEAVGAMDALIDQCAEHLRTRQQFGAPLARLQVLQHRIADLVIATEQLKSMACAAAMAVDAGEPAQRRRIVSAAKHLAARWGRECGLQAIQMHGAMGMTDECRIGHYAKRLTVIGQIWGDAAFHLRRMACPQSGPA
jgi:alkylation response protein AidB-like acyl-CoA dehydrogenase